MARAIIFVGLLVLLPATSGSQETRARRTASRTVAGTVVLGDAAATVHVTLESRTGSPLRTSASPGSPSFSFTVPPGLYSIVLEADGYETIREPLEVQAGVGTQLVEYRMQPIGSNPPGAPGVSVAGLRVPAKARKDYEAAMEAVRDRRADLARARLKKALERWPDYPSALAALALLDAGSGAMDSAVAQLRRAVEIDPAFAEGWATLARILNLRAEYPAALAAGRRAVELRPDAWPGYYETGAALLELGELEPALEAARRIESLARPVPPPELRLLRGGAFLKLHRLPESRAELSAFLRVAAGHPQVAQARRMLQEVEREISMGAPAEQKR